MKKDNLNKVLLANFSGQDNCLTVPKLYVKLLGKFDRAHVLNQIIFWSNKSTVGEDGWFHKSYDEWEDETLIKQKTLERIFNEIKERKLCETKVKKVNGLNRLWVRPDLDNILGALEQILTQPDNLSIPKQTKCRIHETDKLSDSYIEQKSTSEEYLHTTTTSSSNNFCSDYKDLEMDADGSLSKEAKKAKFKKEALEDRKCIGKFNERFSGFDVTIEQLYDDCCDYWSQKDQMVFRSRFLTHLSKCPTTHYPKITTNPIPTYSQLERERLAEYQEYVGGMKADMRLNLIPRDSSIMGLNEWNTAQTTK